MKEKVLKNTDWKMVALVATMSVIVACFYGRNIPVISIFISLPDEYGYLSNAAYFSGTEWGHVNILYYGYGYSLLLIPFFFLCQTGAELIHCAIAVNVLCILGILWVGIAIFRRIYPSMNKYALVLAVTAMCFYPYLCVGSSLVLCENLLSLVVLISCYFLLRLLEDKDWVWAAFLALFTGYAFFVHTRALVFVGGMVFVVCWNTLRKRIPILHTMLFLGLLALVLVIGVRVRSDVEQNVYMQPMFEGIEDSFEEEEVEIGNTVTSRSIVDRIIYVVKDNLGNTVIAFFMRNYYMLVSTMGMFGLGVMFPTMEVGRIRKKKEVIDASQVMKETFVFLAMLMILACAVSQGINTKVPMMNMYGRYFEYMVLPVAYLGILEMMELSKAKDKRMIGYLAYAGVCVIVAFAFMAKLKYKYFYPDFFRISGFTSIAQTTYLKTILVGTAAVVLGLLIAFRLKKERYGQYLVPILFCAFFLTSDVQLVNAFAGHSIAGSGESHLTDAIIAEGYNEADTIYYLCGSEIDRYRYVAIQGYLGKTKLGMLAESQVADIPADSYVITEVDADQLEGAEEATLLFESGMYRVYYWE